MLKRDYRLKGHESFILREGWLTKGLMAVAEDPRVFFQNSGADALGVGTNMAKSIRYWLKTAQLTTENQKEGVNLTLLGRTILENDPYLEDIFSLWVIHSNIARNFELATSWNIFFNRIDVSSFKRDELILMMSNELLIETGEDKLPERSIRGDCAAILRMYSNERDMADDPEEKKHSPFSSLGLLREVEQDHFERTQPPLDQLDPLLLLYNISRILTSEKSLSIDRIVSGYNMPGKILGLNRVAINDFLDSLQRDGYIIVNRTAGLDMVYSDVCPTEQKILNMHYGKAVTHEAE